MDIDESKLITDILRRVITLEENVAKLYLEFSVFQVKINESMKNMENNIDIICQLITAKNQEKN